MKTELYPASCEHLSIRNRIITVPGQWCRFQVIPASCERGLSLIEEALTDTNFENQAKIDRVILSHCRTVYCLSD